MKSETPSSEASAAAVESSSTAGGQGAAVRYRDRVRELRRISAAELRRNPGNWRQHGQQQSQALREVLQSVGFASAVIARELPSGEIEIIDGHLRADTMDDQEVPVLIVDVNDAEAATLLATMDPIAAMAETNERLLHELTKQMADPGVTLTTKLKQMTRKIRAELESQDAVSSQVSVGDGNKETERNTGQSQDEHVRRRIPLSIVLNRDEFAAWCSFKESNGLDDRSALLKLLGYEAGTNEQ